MAVSIHETYALLNPNSAIFNLNDASIGETAYLSKNNKQLINNKLSLDIIPFITYLKFFNFPYSYLFSSSFTFFIIYIAKINPKIATHFKYVSSEHK